MKNQELVRLLEDAKVQYAEYEEYRQLQTAQFFGLDTNQLSAGIPKDEMDVKDGKIDASMGHTSTTVCFYS